MVRLINSGSRSAATGENKNEDVVSLQGSSSSICSINNKHIKKDGKPAKRQKKAEKKKAVKK